MTVEKWINQIDKNTQNFVNTFKDLDHTQLNWKPAPDRWSIAQNIHHLIVINETYYPTFTQLKAGTYKVPFIGKIGFLNRYLGQFILNSVKPDQAKKVQTFPIWEPSTSDIRANILSQFEQHQTELKQWIEDCAPALKQKAVISSPANKMITYPLEMALDIIVTHEQRHLEQAKNVLALQQTASA